MNRRLQHANLGLEKDDKDEAFGSLLYPYIVSALVCLICLKLFLQYAYSFVCRVCFGRQEPIDPLEAEEILANLSEDQRKAVLQSILSKFCKTAMEMDSDISQRELKKKGVAVAETDLPISDLKIPTNIHTLKNTTTAESPAKDDLPLRHKADEDRKEDNDIDFPEEDEGEVDTNTSNSLDDTSTSDQHQPEDNRHLHEENVEENNESGLEAVTIGGDHNNLHMNTGSPYQNEEVIQGKRSRDIEEGADMLKETGEEEWNVCPICLGEYKNGSMLFVSEHCEHIFHVDCILEWMAKKHEDCPICRVKMVTEEEMATAAMALVEKTSRRRFF